MSPDASSPVPSPGPVVITDFHLPKPPCQEKCHPAPTGSGLSQTPSGCPASWQRPRMYPRQVMGKAGGSWSAARLPGRCGLARSAGSPHTNPAARTSPRGRASVCWGAGGARRQLLHQPRAQAAQPPPPAAPRKRSPVSPRPGRPPPQGQPRGIPSPPLSSGLRSGSPSERASAGAAQRAPGAGAGRSGRWNHQAVSPGRAGILLRKPAFLFPAGGKGGGVFGPRSVLKTAP